MLRWASHEDNRAIQVCTEELYSAAHSVCVCVYSNSRNDVPRVAQRYRTIAAHTRRCASVLIVFVVFCVHMHSLAGLIRWTPPPMFSDSAITDRHSDTTIFQLRAHWVNWIGKIIRTCAPGGCRTLNFLHARGSFCVLTQLILYNATVKIQEIWTPKIIL